MEIKSVQKYIVTSPKKIREVVPMIKNLTPSQAYERLPFSGKRAGKVLRKVIGTAIANAKQKEVSEDRLFFKEIQITDGPILRRWRAGARGMAKPYKRRMSHVRVVLGVRDEVAKGTAASDKSTASQGGKKSGDTAASDKSTASQGKNANTESTEKKSEGTEKKRGIGRLVKRGKKSANTEDTEKKSEGTERKNRKEKKA